MVKNRIGEHVMLADGAVPLSGFSHQTRYEEEEDDERKEQQHKCKQLFTKSFCRSSLVILPLLPTTRKKSTLYVFPMTRDFQFSNKT